MASKSYNVILMRDDAHVRRLRIKPVWLKLAVYLLSCVVLLAGAASWLSFQFWTKNEALLDEVAGLQLQAHENAVELQRLQNMERMLKAADPLGQQPVLETLTQGSQNQSTPSGVDLNALLGEKNTGRAVVKKVALTQGDLTWKLSFELSNAEPQRALEGLYVVQLVGTDARHYDVSLDKEQLQFQIQRFKRIEIEFSPPPDLLPADIFGLRLTIDQLGGPTLFTKVWQLSTILQVS